MHGSTADETRATRGGAGGRVQRAGARTSREAGPAGGQRGGRRQMPGSTLRAGSVQHAEGWRAAGRPAGRWAPGRRAPGSRGGEARAESLPASPPNGYTGGRREAGSGQQEAGSGQREAGSGGEARAEGLLASPPNGYTGARQAAGGGWREAGGGQRGGSGQREAESGQRAAGSGGEARADREAEQLYLGLPASPPNAYTGAQTMGGGAGARRREAGVRGWERGARICGAPRALAVAYAHKRQPNKAADISKLVDNCTPPTGSQLMCNAAGSSRPTAGCQLWSQMDPVWSQVRLATSCRMAWSTGLCQNIYYLRFSASGPARGDGAGQAPLGATQKAAQCVSWGLVVVSATGARMGGRAREEDVRPGTGTGTGVAVRAGTGTGVAQHARDTHGATGAGCARRCTSPLATPVARAEVHRRRGGGTWKTGASRGTGQGGRTDGTAVARKVHIELDGRTKWKEGASRALEVQERAGEYLMHISCKPKQRLLLLVRTPTKTTRVMCIDEASSEVARGIGSAVLCSDEVLKGH
ncbi:hypothetical protein GGX14DRAFT_404066 [Mycena pura]|uniref:Uncharacterized protein n=1 Tax=Mycena pura TaxID=153505 RepID=A0AAD6UWR9_9AGAR|nr:hypothetical protein GGX14DRAFT_404066 [Mycena pura]